jgi:pyruvate dehydrogenase E1 component alpha subunit
MNLVEVRAATEDILENIRKGVGPFFLEAVTYRFRGHSMGDPERYRKAEEIHRWQENDPIGIFRRYLVENNFATEEELNKLDDQALEETQEAVQFAESSPEPEPEELFKDIYVESVSS